MTGSALHPVLYYLIILLILFGGMVIYFRVAGRLAIIDRPNERSSHRLPTVRGGGVVFVLALLLWFVGHPLNYTWFIGGALILAAVSFMDDMRPQPALLRTIGQLIAFVLMSIEVGLFNQSPWLIVVTIVIGVGALNAFNFMDGINGITGVYSLANLVTLYFINQTIPYTDDSLLLCIILGVVVFLFFNFRRRARCFAGDVGSVTIAFVQIFLMLQLIYASGHYGWSLLFLLYGIDSIVTIIYRLKKKENIFKAHRSHLYQYFSNELGFPHLGVSLAYGLIQLVANIFLASLLIRMPVVYVVLFVLLTGLLYVAVRESVLKRIGITGLFGKSMTA